MRMLVRFSRDGSRATVGNRIKMVGSLGVKGKEEVLAVCERRELVLKKHTERGTWERMFCFAFYNHWQIMCS